MKIPKGWHELTINQFQELLPSKTEGMNDISKTIHEITTLTGLTYDDIRKYTNKEVKAVRSETAWLSEDRPNVLKNRYKVKGVWYRFEVNASNIILDQYAFSMQTLQDLKDNPETVEQNLHLLLANVSRPIKRNWLFKWVDVKDYDLLKMSEDFKHNMTMDVANPIIVFFCHLSKNLTKITNDYSTKKVEEMEKAVKDLADTVGL
jgi:hypothetical protein